MGVEAGAPAGHDEEDVVAGLVSTGRNVRQQAGERFAAVDGVKQQPFSARHKPNRFDHCGRRNAIARA